MTIIHEEKHVKRFRIQFMITRLLCWLLLKRILVFTAVCSYFPVCICFITTIPYITEVWLPLLNSFDTEEKSQLNWLQSWEVNPDFRVSDGGQPHNKTFLPIVMRRQIQEHIFMDMDMYTDFHRLEFYACSWLWA